MSLITIIREWLSGPRRFGLYDEKDSRTFGAEVVGGLAERSDLTEKDFCNFSPILIDQKWTDFCVGCGKAYAKQATEGRMMSWAGAYALGCKAQGYISEWGISILQVMKGAVKYGTPEESKWPFNGDRNAAADYSKMGKDVLDNAYEHRDGSFFVINGQAGWDQFDLFRAFLNKYRENKVVIQTGADAHNITLIGQVTENGVVKLYGPDSYGLRAGKYRLGETRNGFRYFTREEVNQMFSGYMAFDMERPLAELLVAYNGKAVKMADSNDCFLVSKGERHFLKNEAIAWAHNTLLFGDNYVFTLSEEDFYKIPNGTDAKFEEGPNRDIILRILEKLEKVALIEGK